MTAFVLLHGFAQTPASWDAVVQRLQAAGHRTYVLDLYESKCDLKLLGTEGALEDAEQGKGVEGDAGAEGALASARDPLASLGAVCDRVAASRIYLGDRYTDASPWEYYDRSKGHYMLHPETRALLEKLLKMVRDLGQERTFAYMKFLLGCQTDY